MKDSGIEWIGVIPEDWRISRINRIFNLKAGGDVKPEFYSFEKNDNHRFPVYTNNRDANAIYAYTSSPMFPEDTITVTGRGDIGIAHHRKEPYDAIIRLLVLIPKFNLDSRFFAYFINNVIEFQVESSAIGQLSTLQIAPYQIVVPSNSQQQKIANFLDQKVSEIDHILEKTRESIEEYKKYKQSIITEAVTKGLNPNVKMKDSGIKWIGEIPKHWEITKLKYYFEKGKNAIRVGPFGSQLKGNDFIQDGMWVYNQRTVLDRNFTTNDTFVSNEKFNELKGFSVELNDILVTTRGSIGKICRIPENYNKGIIHPCIIKFKLNDKLFNYRLLEIIFNESEFVKNQFSILSNSTTIDVIYSETLKNILLPLIPIEEQLQIKHYLDNKCTEIDNLISQKETLLKGLELYRKSLIYECVTGKGEVM